MIRFLAKLDDFSKISATFFMALRCANLVVMFWKNGELNKWSSSAFDRFLITFLRKTFFQSIPSRKKIFPRRRHHLIYCLSTIFIPMQILASSSMSISVGGILVILKVLFQKEVGL